MEELEKCTRLYPGTFSIRIIGTATHTDKLHYSHTLQQYSGLQDCPHNQKERKPFLTSTFNLSFHSSCNLLFHNLPLNITPFISSSILTCFAWFFAILMVSKSLEWSLNLSNKLDIYIEVRICF